MLGGGVVGDVDGLDIHGERSVSVVGLTTSPLDGTLTVVGVAAGPDTDADAHGGLGEVLARDCIGVIQCADDLAVQEPLDATGGPVDGVGVEGGLGVRDSDGSATVVSGSIALSEVVGLDFGVVGADLLL